MSQWWYFVTGPSSHTNLAMVSIVKVIECDLVVIVMVVVHHLTGLTTGGDGNENQVVVTGEYHANVLIVEPFGMSPLNCLGSITTTTMILVISDKLVDLMLKLC